jgi:hypothetical protein
VPGAVGTTEATLLLSGMADAVMEERMGTALNTAITAAPSANLHLRVMTLPP